MNNHNYFKKINKSTTWIIMIKIITETIINNNN